MSELQMIKFLKINYYYVHHKYFSSQFQHVHKLTLHFERHKSLLRADLMRVKRKKKYLQCLTSNYH